MIARSETSGGQSVPAMAKFDTNSAVMLNAQKEPERLSGERLETYVLNRKKGAGMGLPFAVEMVNRTNIPVGLIPCAHGGTSMENSERIRGKLAMGRN